MLETLQIINYEFPQLVAAFIFVVGAITGSFLNVCIYRIPEGRSVVYPGSTCSCGQPIAWYNNLPILSWIFLRGKASCCGAPFSVRYPAIEFLTGLLYLFAWFGHTPLVAIVGMLYISFLICSTFIDFDHMIIPDRFSIGGTVIGVAISFLVPSLHGIEGPFLIANIQSGITSLIGATVGAGLVYWIMVLGEVVFRKPAMGEGDVKFVGFIGAFCGWQGAIFAMFGGALIGSIVLLPILLLARIFDWKMKAKVFPEDFEDGVVPPEAEAEMVQLGSQVPFGPMLAAAGLLYFLGLDTFVDSYFLEVFGHFFSAP